MQKKLENYTFMPIRVSNRVPVHNARGGITGYDVTVRYYTGKKFSHDKPAGWQAARDNAVNWVYNMQCAGYRLLRSPKYTNYTTNSGVGVSVAVICERTHHFAQFPFIDSSARAMRFWKKMHDEIAKINQETINSIYENIK